MLRLSTNELLFKHGNSETMSDFMEDNNLWPDNDGIKLLPDYVEIPNDVVLKEYEIQREEIANN